MENLQGIYDMHVHTAPDLIPRKYTDFQLVDAAVRAGAAGIVIKAHHGSTAARACLCNWYVRKAYGAVPFTMYGGIALNNDVGGFNPKAVETAADLGAKEVWLPTIDAENDREKQGRLGGLKVTGEDGNLRPEVVRILEIVRDHSMVLSTGHISPEEIFKVCEAARNMGITRIVITHPEFWIVGLSLAEQKKLIEQYDVIMERCYKQPLSDHTWKDNCEDNIKAVKTLGWKNTAIATDSGQTVNEPWEEALLHVVRTFADAGISHEAIQYMTRTVQKKLLGLS